MTEQRISQLKERIAQLRHDHGNTLPASLDRAQCELKLVVLTMRSQEITGLVIAGEMELVRTSMVLEAEHLRRSGNDCSVAHIQRHVANCLNAMDTSMA